MLLRGALRFLALVTSRSDVRTIYLADYKRVWGIGVIHLLVLFLGRLRLPLFSSLLWRGRWLVKRTLGTSVPTFIRLIFCLLEFYYDYLGFAGFVDYAYLDRGTGGGEGGRT